MHCRSNKFAITIKDTIFDGIANGYHAVSGICGDAKQQLSLTLTGNISSSGATLNSNNTAQYTASILNANDGQWDRFNISGANFSVNGSLHRYCRILSNPGYYTITGAADN